MKSLVLKTTLLTFACSAAFAGKINLDARTEMESYSTNDKLAKPAYTVFKVSRLKIDFQGALGELNTYRVRLDPLKTSEAPSLANKRSGTGPDVDFAFLTHKLTDEWNLSMGKVITGMGGAEAMNNPGDIYLRSVAGDEIATVFWPVGMQAQGVWGDHKLNINVVNVSEDVTTGGNVSSTSPMYGLTYMGKFSEGAILPSISYHTEDFKDSATVKQTRNYLAVGAKFLVSDFEIEADMLSNTRKPDPQAAAKALDTTSAVALVRYKMETGSVHLKYENSAVNTSTGVDTKTKSDITGLTLAYEFKPIKDDNWRFHVAATQKDTKPENGDTQSEKKVLVGMRILADFLK